MTHAAVPTSERNLQHTRRGLTAAWVMLAICMGCSGGLQAQTRTVPQPGAAAARATAAPAGKGVYTNANIAERPFDQIHTRPQYPSTAPVQKQYSVTYLYNYAQSQYTPPAPLPTVSKAAQSFATPENAVIALVSAMRRGSYEDWLACWDAASQAGYTAQEKAQPAFRAKTVESFKPFAAGHLVFSDRVDTVNYVILDLADDDPKSPRHGLPNPVLLVFEQGRWVASSQFGADGLLLKQAFALPGQAMTQTFDLRPEGKGSPAVNRAQESFLNQHTQSQKVTVAVE